MVSTVENVFQQGIVVLDNEVGIIADVEPEWLPVLLPQDLVVTKDNFLIAHDLGGRGVVTVQRNLPGPPLVLTGADEELLLAEDQLSLVVDRGRNDWVARLLQPGVHDLADVETGCLTKGLPEVAPLGVVVLVSGEVVL